MQIYSIIASKRGRIYSSLIVTYPAETAPSNLLTLSIKGASNSYSSSLRSFKLTDGEIPTSLPFKTVRVLSGSGGSLIVLANDDFVGSASKDSFYEVNNIILAVEESKYIKPADGLAYLLNEMDKNHIETSRMKLWPYIYSNSTTTMKMLDALRNHDTFKLSDFVCFGVERLALETNQYLPFINLAQSRFQEAPKDALILRNKDFLDNQDKIIAKILDKPNINLFANLKVSAELLRNIHPEKPNIVDNAAGNDLLLRSIIISNWLNNSNNVEDKRRAARMIVQYRLPVKSWKEYLLTAIWTLQWEFVTWMGYPTISYIKRYRNELTGSKEAISLIRKRTLVLLLFPIFFITTTHIWQKLSLHNDGYFPFTLLSVILAVFVPAFGINLSMRLAKIKIKKLANRLLVFSFILTGVLLSYIPFQLKDLYLYLFLSIPLAAWLIWVLVPIKPKVGIIAFFSMLLSIPFSSILIGSSQWYLLRLQLESYNDVEIIISQFTDLFEQILHYLSRFF
jgi:hypothetical protein